MQKKFVISLGSGGLRGFVHLGVYKALFENKIKIDAIYGTSVGSLVGAFISAGFQPDELIKIALEISLLEILDFTFPKNGYIKGEKLNLFIKKNISIARIQDLPIPLTVVATRTHSGEVEYFQSGPLSDCVQASSAIPNVFRPVLINGIEYLDGDLCSPVPIHRAREDYQKSAVILAVNIIPGAPEADRSSLKWGGMISRTVYRQALVSCEKKYADFLINPTLGYGVNFSKKDALKRIDIGYKQTLVIIPQIKQFLATV